MKVRKKTLVLLALAAALGLAAVAGTAAWFSAKAPTVTNVFFVGSFQPPTTPPPGLTGEYHFDPDTVTFLYEPHFSADAALIQPGVSVVKDPYVGIGKGSPSAYVYVYVKNDFGSSVYFALNEGWEPVEDQTTAGPVAGSYSAGLFRYAQGGALTELDAADADAWTAQPVFSAVTTYARAELSAMPEEGNITLYAKIYEAALNTREDPYTVRDDAAAWATTM